MKSNKGSFIFGVVCGVACLYVVLKLYSVFLNNTEASLRETAQLLAPPPIPTLKQADPYDLTFASLPDSAAVNLRSAEDKVVFLNFWGTWCGPCVAELPNIEKLSKRFKGKKVEFYIVSDEPLNTLRSFATKRNFDLPFYKLNSPLPPIYRGLSFPRTYIISKGEIIMSHTGAANWNDASIIDLIKTELSANK